MTIFKELSYIIFTNYNNFLSISILGQKYYFLGPTTVEIPQPNWRHYTSFIHSNIRSVVEFQRWWVQKSKLFGQESTCHQGKIFKKFLRVMTVRQKVPKLYFQSQFWMSKINRIFSKKKLSKNTNLGDHYLLNFFFLNSIFEPLYFLKLRPIFGWLS